MAMHDAFQAIGTSWTIRIDNTPEDSNVSGVLSKVHAWIDGFDKEFSRFRRDSLVWRIAQAPGSFQFSVDASPMFQWYRTLYDATDGLVTPLIGQVLHDAGYDDAYSFVERSLVSPPAWDDVMTWDASRGVLTTTEPVLFDFGAAGKGYAIDRVTQLFESHGYHDVVINAGGDIRHLSSSGQRERVGLEDPCDTSRVLGEVLLGNESICGSAGNRRTWGRFHHTIDPKRLTSPREFRAIWVRARDAMIADGLTTALQFVTPDRLSSMPEFSFAIVKNDGSVFESEGFHAMWHRDELGNA